MGSRADDTQMLVEADVKGEVDSRMEPVSPSVSDEMAEYGLGRQDGNGE